MIQKLRLKLIMASILSLFLVLIVIEGIIGIMNYGKIIKDADRVLNILSENSGRFPERFPPESDYSRLSPEIPFESRFFSVLVDYKGNVILTDTGKIAAINETDAITYAQVVLEKQRERGFIDNYRYSIYQSETGERIIFLDCRRQQEMFQNLVFNAVWVSLLGLGSVFLLMVYLSSRIVKPFSDNYEKQKRFITDAGHELRTPLTIINADADILEMDFGENEWLSDIQIQTKRMADLTNTLIVLSRMEEGLQTEMVVEFPLSDMAEEIVTAFQALAKVQQKELRSSIMPMICMKGDQKAIYSLFTILLDNAIKYSDEKGMILVTLEKKRNKIRFSVFNTTEYISKDQITHLFDRFFRIDDSRNSQTGGYGLGLSIAAATAAAHKGTITAETKDEKSLQITVTFPI